MAYAFVQAKNYSSNSSTQTTSGVVSFGSAVTAGDTLILTAVYESATVVPITSVTDQSANPLSFVAASSVVNGTNNSMQVLYLLSAPAMTGIIVNFTSGSIAFNCAEYSGIAGVLDGSTGGTATATTAANNIVFPTVTNANQPALFFAVAFDDSHFNSGPTVGTGFTTHGSNGHVPEPADSGNNPGNIQDKRLTTTGAQTATMTNTATSGDLFLMISLALDESGFAPPPSIPAQGPMPRRKFILP